MLALIFSICPANGVFPLHPLERHTRTFTPYFTCA
jgi:hypothetical protein